jgi:hypothetical protein
MRAFSSAMFRSVVDFRHDLVHAGRREVRVGLRLVLLHRLARGIGVGADRGVLVEAAQHEHHVVGQGDRGGIPSGVLLVGRLRRLRVVDVARIAAREERRGRVDRKQLRAERVDGPVLSRAGHPPGDPGFRLGVEDVDLAQAIVALHVVAAEHVDAAVGERHPGVAVGVVEVAAREAHLRERVSAWPPL